MPDAEDDDWWGTASADDVRAIVFAREAAIAAERDEARRELEHQKRQAAEWTAQAAKQRARADKAEAELAAPADVPPMLEDARACESPRIGEPRIPCSEIGRGAVLGQWIDYARALAADLRTAEKQRDHWRRECTGIQEGPLREARDDLDEARRELEAEREKWEQAEGENEKLALRLDEAAGIALRVKDELAAAQAELAALKGQVTVPLEQHERIVEEMRDQHEAALAEARMEERKRCAGVCESYASGCRDHIEMDAPARRSAAHRCAAAIRALAEKGGEVGK